MTSSERSDLVAEIGNVLAVMRGLSDLVLDHRVERSELDAAALEANVAIERLKRASLGLNELVVVDELEAVEVKWPEKWIASPFLALLFELGLTASESQGKMLVEQGAVSFQRRDDNLAGAWGLPVTAHRDTQLRPGVLYRIALGRRGVMVVIE